MFRIAVAIIALSLIVLGGAYYVSEQQRTQQTGLSVFQPVQGGTGTSTAPGNEQILIGDGSGNYIVDDIATYAAAGDPFAWTPTDYGVSTSTTLGFLNGFLSTASSTITDVLHADGTIDFQNLYNIDAALSSGLNRLIFKSSEGNADAELIAIPVGANTGSEFIFSDSPNLNNFGGLAVGTDGTVNFVRATSSGSGTTLPLAFDIDGTEAMRVGTSGNIGVGTTSPTSQLSIGSAGSAFRINSSGTVEEGLWNGTVIDFSDFTNAIDGDGITFSGDSITADLGTSIDSTEIEDSSIVNADINGSAAIAYSKLNLTDSLLEADLDATNSASDNQVLSFDNGTGGFTWVDDDTGSSVGTIATSTTPTQGHIPLWTSSGAFPETLGSVATTSATIGSTLDYTGTFGALVGGAAGTLSLADPLDLGGFTSFEIPNGGSPTANAAGEIAIDTTSGQLIWHDGSEQKQIVDEQERSFEIASTTPSLSGGNFQTATSTYTPWTAQDGWTLTSIYCETNTGTVELEVFDSANTLTCDSDGATTTPSVTSVAEGAGVPLTVGSLTGGAGGLRGTVKIQITAD